MQHEDPPTPQQLGVWHHVRRGTLDTQAVYKAVMDRGYTPPKPPGVNARDVRWRLQRYDKNGMRTEIMVRNPFRNPVAQRTWILTSNDYQKP